MNKKAFVLMETIVVIVVISVALLSIFASYNKILSKVKTENKYDTSEYIYMTNYIKKYLEKPTCYISPQSITNSSVTNHYNYNDVGTCNIKSNGVDKFNVKGIYLLNNLNSSNDDNLKKFDAYMIDYIRKLDVGNNDTLLIVEYNRVALDNQGNPIVDTEGNTMTETYIASLEWDE